jgi:hypothetical protein
LAEKQTAGEDLGTKYTLQGHACSDLLPLYVLKFPLSSNNPLSPESNEVRNFMIKQSTKTPPLNTAARHIKPLTREL